VAPAALQLQPKPDARFRPATTERRRYRAGRRSWYGANPICPVRIHGCAVIGELEIVLLEVVKGVLGGLQVIRTAKLARHRGCTCHGQSGNRDSSSRAIADFIIQVAVGALQHFGRTLARDAFDPEAPHLAGNLAFLRNLFHAARRYRSKEGSLWD